jgi:hypothetical protein
VQVFEQSCRIVGRLLKAERTVRNVRSVAVALLLEGYDLAVACQLGQNVAEGGLDRIAAAMQQHQERERRVRGAVNFIIEFEATDGSVTGFPSQVRCCSKFPSCMLGVTSVTNRTNLRCISSDKFWSTPCECQKMCYLPSQTKWRATGRSRE